MPTTPNITLTATLGDLTGQPAGSTANPAKLRIGLCGFGPALPFISGTTMLARTGPFSLYSTGLPISTQLWGNDQITPAGTYYTIEILDGEDNVVQCGAYQLTGPGTYDLSALIQVLPPYFLSFAVTTIQYVSCNAPPRLPNNIFTAAGIVLAVAYNGVLLGPEYYSIVGTQITLTFTTELGDRIDALCVVP